MIFQAESEEVIGLLLNLSYLNYVRNNAIWNDYYIIFIRHCIVVYTFLYKIAYN